MLDFYEKRKLKSLVYSKFTIVLLLVATAWLSFSVFERYSAEREAAARRAEQARELDALQMRATALETEVEHLESERGIEEEIRDRFEVAKEGEQVIVIVGAAEAKRASTSDTDAASSEKSLLDWLIFW